MKRLFVSLLCAVLLGQVVCAQSLLLQKPNILIILADDLGPNDLSYTGTPYVRTPNIDSLYKAGMHFGQFYANSPVCSPSRASIMSGRYPELVGVPGLIRSTPDQNFGYLKPTAKLLAKQLKEANYHTAIVGKWNLGLESPNLPNEKGFDLFHGFLDDMMEDYWTHVRNGRNFMRLNDKEIDPKGHATDLFSDWAADYVKSRKGQKNPFFLYLAYNAPHFPIQPPEDWLKKVREREPGLSEKQAKLVALIEHMDDGIGKVIRTLKETKQYENTLIIFLSDNGGNLEVDDNNGNLRDGKQSMYEGGIRVPAIFVWPGKIKPGAENNERVLQMDLYPTLAEIAGAPVKHTVDGISFRSLLENPAAHLPARPLFFTRREGNMKYSGQTIQAVIDGDWKLLQNSPYEPYELYNLKDDPREQNNVIKTNAEIHKKLQLLLIKQIQRSGSIPWQKPDDSK